MVAEAPTTTAHDIPVLFQVTDNGDGERGAAKRLVDLLANEPLVGETIESWHTPNHQYIDGSDSRYRLDLTPKVNSIRPGSRADHYYVNEGNLHGGMNTIEIEVPMPAGYTATVVIEINRDENTLGLVAKDDDFNEIIAESVDFEEFQPVGWDNDDDDEDDY